MKTAAVILAVKTTANAITSVKIPAITASAIRNATMIAVTISANLKNHPQKHAMTAKRLKDEIALRGKVLVVVVNL